MNIAVCDDKTNDRKILCALVRDYCEKHSLDANVEGFRSGKALLRRMGKIPFTVVMLDISLQNEHGEDIARTICDNYSDCNMFFCTASKEYGLLGFELNVRHYMIKPIVYSQVEEALNRCGSTLRFLGRTLLVSNKPVNKVLMKDIFYVNARNKDCYIHTANGITQARQPMVKLAAELKTAAFLHCHRNYIVNLAYIQGYDKNDFILDNNDRIPIRRKGREDLKKAFRDYYHLGVRETA